MTPDTDVLVAAAPPAGAALASGPTGLAFARPAYLAASPWLVHLPAVLRLVAAVRPAHAVLAGGDGVAHLAVCQGIAALGLEATCLWLRPVPEDAGEPDANAGSPEDPAHLAGARYPAVSRTLPLLPGAPLPPPGNEDDIDLLFVDPGLAPGRLAALRRDWLPWLSARAVLVGPAPGTPGDAAALTAEMARAHPTVIFSSGDGLAAVLAGPTQPEALRRLAAAGPEDSEHAGLARLGEACVLEQACTTAEHDAARQRARARRLRGRLDEVKANLRIHKAYLRTRGEQMADLQARLAAREGELDGLRDAAAAAQTAEAAAAEALAAAQRLRADAERAAGAVRAEHAELVQYARDLEARHLRHLSSRSWTALEPVRRLARRLRGRKTPTPFVPKLDDGARLPAAPAPKPSGSAARGPAALLEEKLWGGFSGPALAELEALKTAASTPRVESSEAGWALARWHAAHGDFVQAYSDVLWMRTANPTKALTMRCMLLEADCLIRRGDGDDARVLLRRGLRKKPDSSDLCLAMANTFAGEGPDGDTERLDWINRIYATVGLAPLALHDATRPLAVDNLAAAAVPAADARQAKVSVIMPVYRAAATLPFALRGLRAQTWDNLEILVVDDCSPDNTVAVAEAIAAEDPRVRVIRQSANRGSYAARNAGLAGATGDFITTHDADDWSHPQKLELQVRHFLARPGTVATYSFWIRCTEDVVFRGLFRPWGRLVSKNVSSLMFPRAVMDELGGWVEARVGSDSELMRRCEALRGARALAPIAFDGPLAFSLHEERSLTRQSTTHVKTVYYGVRKELHDASAHWRRAVPRSALTLDPARDPLPFPAPASIRPERVAEIACDILFVGDFAMSGGAYESTLSYVRAAIAAGRSVAVFHWRRYDLDVSKPIHAALRELAQRGALTVVAPGERVRAGTVVVGYPVILRHEPDQLPEIACDALVVVVNQMAARLAGGGDPQYDPAELRATLRRRFGTEGVWVPISGLVQRLMRADPRYPAPSDTVWVPLIDTATWCAEPLRWRGGDGRAPVVGRHARDHYTKWPRTAEALAQAYCAGQPCQVEIMGGADRALQVLGARPGNWTVHGFGAMEAREFLRRLDVFVHYPHEDYIEEFGRAVLEALASGLPAVLPPVFRETFGGAALYAEPAETWNRIEALWSDEDAYLTQAGRGRDFVLAQSDWAEFPARLARTVAKATGAPGTREQAQDSHP